MRLIHRLDPGTLLPPKDLEIRLAGLALENPLYSRILERLAARPKRYSELRPVLRGKNDNNLTVALKRLRAEGLVEQLADARLPKADAFLYGLTYLGVQVLFTVKVTQVTQAAQHLVQTEA